MHTDFKLWLRVIAKLGRFAAVQRGYRTPFPNNPSLKNKIPELLGQAFRGKKTFRIQRRHTAHACAGYGLPIHMIGKVASRKDPRDRGATLT